MPMLKENLGNSNFIDIPKMKIETIKLDSKTESLNINDLKYKLENLFPLPQKDIIQPETSINNNLDENKQTHITLDDGTIVNFGDISKKENINKIDDNGNIYAQGDKLVPNNTFELKDTTYTTDEQGRTIYFDANPVITPQNIRDNGAQLNIGGEDRRPNDHGGHIVGRDINGDSGIGNLISMDSRINQSDYKKMENDIKTFLNENKDVSMKGSITYEGDSKRPDKITVSVTTNEEKAIYKFDNNIDGSLKNEISKIDMNHVQNELNAKDGKISSIKELYDSNNVLVETIVNITSQNYRSKIIIDNTLGGEV